MLEIWWETAQTGLTLEIVTFSIHEDVVHQNDTEDARPEVNVTEHKHEPDILK